MRSESTYKSQSPRLHVIIPKPRTTKIPPEIYWTKNWQTVTIPGGGVLGWSLVGYVPLASQNPYPIIVYSVASYRPHLSRFWANVIVISRTEFNASRLLNIKTTAGTIFQPRIFLFLNPCLPEFSYPKNSENLRPHSSNSTKNVTPFSVSPVVENATPSSGTSPVVSY